MRIVRYDPTTDAHDDAVADTAAEGRRVAAAFFASDRWASQYALATRHGRDEGLCEGT